MIRAVLFDMDGLIVDTEPIHFKAFRAYMARHGIEMPESMMPQFLGYTEEDNLRDLKAEYELDTPLEEMVADRGAVYLDLIRSEPLKVLPGFWDLSAEVRRRGLKQAVVSSANGRQVEIVLGRLFEERPGDESPASHFDAIVTGDDIENNKPAPDIYLLGPNASAFILRSASPSRTRRRVCRPPPRPAAPSSPSRTNTAAGSSFQARGRRSSRWETARTTSISRS